MKKTISQLALTAAAVAFITISPGVFAQSETTTTTSTTTSAGTISEFSPTVITVKSEAAEPIKYTYTKSTTYVDENGQPVSMDIVKSGLPVTVYYTKDGDNMVATKVVVKKVVTQAVPDGGATVDKKTTTTTTTTDK